MSNHINRLILKYLQEDLGLFPVVCLIGPRQCGKSTLAKEILEGWPGDYLFLDLERPRDLEKLAYEEEFLQEHQHSLVCLDEVQHKPQLFPVLRYLVDNYRVPGRYFILGSASAQLINQSSESLAGRICYRELSPFILCEVIQAADGGNKKNEDAKRLWLRGGFPNAFLAPDDALSHRWKEQFLKTIVERDMPLMNVRVPSLTLFRLFSMLCHSHGQLINFSKLGDALGFSHTTLRQYIDLFEHMFFVRCLLPFEGNLKKRLVKSPKIFIRDSGILHSLLNITSVADLFAHPVCGHSWEGFVIENIIQFLSVKSGWSFGFYRTHAGSEIDLVLAKDTRCIAVECKLSNRPTLTKGFWQGCVDLGVTEAYIVSPVSEGFPAGSSGKTECRVLPLWDFLAMLG